MATHQRAPATDESVLIPSPISSQLLQKIHQQIPTPALLVFDTRVEANLRRMIQKARQAGVNLRPHAKTHKSLHFARQQLQLGAIGLTVATISEALVFANNGFTNLFIAHQITQAVKIKRLRELHDKIDVIVGLDNERQIKLWQPYFQRASKPLKVRIEIDSGLHRCGVKPGPHLAALAQAVTKTPWLSLEGIFTHAGHAYSTPHSQQELVAREEQQVILRALQILQDQGLPNASVSIGSTPTMEYPLANHITEIRPGNYIFYDAMQLHIQQHHPSRLALFVLTTVVSTPDKNRVVIDAGSKALHTDGASLTGHFGLTAAFAGRVVRLSEEHGILATSHPLKIGDAVLVVPNHACATVNLFKRYYLINDRTFTAIPIDARGYDL